MGKPEEAFLVRSLSRRVNPFADGSLRAGRHRNGRIGAHAPAKASRECASRSSCGSSVASQVRSAPDPRGPRTRSLCRLVAEARALLCLPMIAVDRLGDHTLGDRLEMRAQRGV